MTEPKHPVQPLVMDDKKVLRFKRNQIVDDLLDMQVPANFPGYAARRAEILAKTGGGPLDLNTISVLVQQGVYSTDDFNQLGQLIGYSYYGVPSYITTETLEVAKRLYDGDATDEKTARIQTLEQHLGNLLSHLRPMAVAAFQVHADDLVPEIGEIPEGEE